MDVLNEKHLIIFSIKLSAMTILKLAVIGLELHLVTMAPE